MRVEEELYVELCKWRLPDVVGHVQISIFVRKREAKSRAVSNCASIEPADTVGRAKEGKRRTGEEMKGERERECSTGRVVFARTGQKRERKGDGRKESE